MTSTARPGWVFYVSLILLLAFVGLGADMPDLLTAWSQRALEFTTLHFGWLYLFATTGFLIFSAGMGVGLVFWGVAEPMTHYLQPPMGLAGPRTPEAANVAFRYSLFHWGFHQWANFAIVGLAIAYVRFRRRQGGLFSETFRPTPGDRVDGPLGKASAGLAVVAFVSPAVSLLVLTGVMATTRTRRICDATILHSLGARLTAIRHSLQMECVLSALNPALLLRSGG